MLQPNVEDGQPLRNVKPELLKHACARAGVPLTSTFSFPRLSRTISAGTQSGWASHPLDEERLGRVRPMKGFGSERETRSPRVLSPQPRSASLSLEDSPHGGLPSAANATRTLGFPVVSLGSERPGRAVVLAHATRRALRVS